MASKSAFVSSVVRGTHPPVEPFVLACQDSGAVPTLRMAADHGEFAFRSPHQPMQICGLGRYACGKATGCKPPAVVEALGVEFDYKREEAFCAVGLIAFVPAAGNVHQAEQPQDPYEA